MNNKFKTAVIQLDSQADEGENLTQIQKYLAEAAAEGIQLAVLPETADYIGKGFKEHAKEVPGEISEFFSGEAKKYGIYLHGGSITMKNPGGNPYNTSLFYLPDGNLLGEYSKLHMFDVDIGDGVSQRESKNICPGDEIALVQTRLAVFGLAICYDLRFPELFRVMADYGAQVLVLPANFTNTTGMAHWEALLRARAIENTCYVIACNQCGEKEAFTSYGHSMVISPWGEILADAGSSPGYVVAEIDLEYLAEVRKRIPSLLHERKDVYHLAAKRLQVYKEEDYNI